jgi:hypothetical protein
MELSPNLLKVVDSIEGMGSHQIEIFFHFHPDAEVEVQLDPNLIKSVEPTTYHPEFNLAMANTTIVGRYSGHCPIQFTCAVSLP